LAKTKHFINALIQKCLYWWTVIHISSKLAINNQDVHLKTTTAKGEDVMWGIGALTDLDDGECKSLATNLKDAEHRRLTELGYTLCYNVIIEREDAD
jgi:hypothetical protein